MAFQAPVTVRSLPLNSKDRTNIQAEYVYSHFGTMAVHEVYTLYSMANSMAIWDPSEAYVSGYGETIFCNSSKAYIGGTQRESLKTIQVC